MNFKHLIDHLFNDAVLTRVAIYRPQGLGDGYPVKVMVKQPDIVVPFGQAQIHTTQHTFEVRIEEVREPAIGDTFTLNNLIYVLQSEACADREQLVWSLDVYQS